MNHIHVIIKTNYCCMYLHTVVREGAFSAVCTYIQL